MFINKKIAKLKFLASQLGSLLGKGGEYDGLGRAIVLFERVLAHLINIGCANFLNALYRAALGHSCD